VGRGEVYYVAAKTDQRFTDDLMRALAHRTGVRPVVADLPAGVNAQRRTDGSTETLITMTFNPTGAAGLPGFGVKWETRSVGDL
jgi:beta-galactosidase